MIAVSGSWKLLCWKLGSWGGVRWRWCSGRYLPLKEFISYKNLRVYFLYPKVICCGTRDRAQSTIFNDDAIDGHTTSYNIQPRPDTTSYNENDNCGRRRQPPPTTDNREPTIYLPQIRTLTDNRPTIQ
jgi:hypothetical protein